MTKPCDDDDSASAGPLAARPFCYQRIKGDRVQLFYEGKWVSTLSGSAALKFMSAVDAADDAQAQLLMAKATKNFKRGNERAGQQRRAQKSKPGTE